MSHKSVDIVNIEVEQSDNDNDDDEPKPKTTKVVKKPQPDRLTITRKKVKDLSEAERNQLIFVRR